MTAPLPTPGLHENVPERVYRSWPAWSQSVLKHGNPDTGGCMAAMKWELDHDGMDDEPSEAMKVGTAVGRLVLEPERGVAWWRGGDRRSAAAKAEWADFCNENKDECILDVKLEPMVTAMADALRAHPVVASLLAMPHKREVSAFWIDPETGEPCKAHMDLLVVNPNATATVLDFKKVGGPRGRGAASPAKVKFYLDDFDVPFQGATYSEAVLRTVPDIVTADYGIACVEEAEPHLSAFYWIGEQSIMQGRADRLRALRKAADCRKTGVWSGYADGGIVELPHWRLQEQAL